VKLQEKKQLAEILLHCGMTRPETKLKSKRYRPKIFNKWI